MYCHFSPLYNILNRFKKVFHPFGAYTPELHVGESSMYKGWALSVKTIPVYD